MGTAGSRRLVVGAHYGVLEFIGQRVTAVVLSLYTIGLAIGLLAAPSPIQYEDWVHLFTWTAFGLPLGKLFAYLAVLSLAYHTWVGMRDIWMDYIKPTWLRLTILVLTVLWLLGSAVYAAQILWRV
ncbi:MAG TPA: succinate dehydrogenase, hydrophobic membrane anchor protein [Burkholderiaceae bacterium]|nr:succinate dehydrogenase, hydrophobic membrane anchor protein [Burkholderiaceae bacterium]